MHVLARKGASADAQQNFTPTASVFKIKAWRFSLIFVSLDVVAFFIQTAGAAVAVSLDGPMKATGIGIYMDGIGFQQACILGFLFLAWKLHQDMMLLPPSKERKQSIRLIFVQYAVVTLITARIIFRLIEYAQGLESSVPKQEVYQ